MRLKILVRSPNWIGDQVMAYPFFYFLRRAYPQAHIVAACMPWVQSIQFKDLINEIYVLPRALDDSLGAKFGALENAARDLRSRGPWDLGFSLPNSLSSAWLLFRSGVKSRRGYDTDGRGLLLNSSVSWQGRKSFHRADDYVGLLPDGARPQDGVRHFWGIPPETELEPGVPGVKARFDAETAWPDAEVISPPEGPYWVLAPGSQAESRRWPLENFSALARQIQSQTGWTGVVVGGVAEARLASELTEDESLRLIDLTAQGSVSALWKVFAGARFTVSNDSGLAHVAALCGSPVQIVWGAGDPKRTEPLGPGRVRVMLNPVDCWPCERNTCDLPTGKKFECLRGIQAEALWKEIQSGIQLN